MITRRFQPREWNARARWARSMHSRRCSGEPIRRLDVEEICDKKITYGIAQSERHIEGTSAARSGGSHQDPFVTWSPRFWTLHQIGDFCAGHKIAGSWWNRRFEYVVYCGWNTLWQVTGVNEMKGVETR